MRAEPVRNPEGAILWGFSLYDVRSQRPQIDHTVTILRDTTTTHAVLWDMDKDQYLALIESPEFLLYVEAHYENAWRHAEAKRVALAIAAALKMVAEKTGY